MKINEIRALLMGKVISYYDGWNGSMDYFKIGHVQKDGSSIRVFATKGKGFGVFIPGKAIAKLVEVGEYKESKEIERCPFEVRWRLF